MQKIFLWGTGNIASDMMEGLGEVILGNYDVLGVIDNNFSKQGDSFFGIPVLAPNVLTESTFEFVVILTDYYEEISSQIIRDLHIDSSAVKNKYFFLQEAIFTRYKGTDDNEILKIIDYIQENGVHVFNYNFTEKYKQYPIISGYDKSKDMFYVVHKGKRIYLRKSICTQEAAERYFRHILLEQDEESPHRYLNGANTPHGGIVVDAGAAEGFFALEVIDDVSKIYLIESDQGWVEALQATFREYTDKVIIVNKFITSYDYGIYAKLDSIIKEDVSFIKLDVEGNEWDALQGCEAIIERSKDIRCAVCVYHTDYDEIICRDMLEKLGMHCTVSNGYMLFPYRTKTVYISTKLHRGLLYAEK